MEAVAVQEVVVALEPLWPLAEGPALHICSVVLNQGLLEHHDGSLVVAVIVEPHPGGEGTLGRGDRDRAAFWKVFIPKGPVLLKDRSDLAWRNAKTNL